MTTQTTVVGSPTLPRVNLLPPEIAQARQLRQYRLIAAGAVAATAALVGGVYFHSHGGVATAQASLDQANARTGKLQTQVAQYQSVTQVKAQVASAQSTLDAALAPQILWSRYLQDMSVSLAGNYWFSTMLMSSGGTSAPGATGTPFADTNAIGSIALTGVAVSHFDVADLLRDLAKEKGLSHPTLTSSNEAVSIGTNKLVQFNAVVPVDSTQKPGATTAATPATPATPAGGAAGSPAAGKPGAVNGTSTTTTNKASS